MNIHITLGEESSGPFSLEEVQAYLAEGILLPDDLAWHEGLENCIPLAELVGQSAAPESAPLPPVSVVAEAVPADQVPVESMAKPRSRKGLLIAAGAGVAVLVIAAVVWFGFLRPDGSNQEELKVVAAGEPKDKGSSTPAPPKTNAPVVPVSPQPVVTNAPAGPVNPGGNAKPRPPSPTFLAAHKVYQAGKYQEAIKLFETELAAEKEKPKSDELSVGRIHIWLGQSYYLAGLLDKALENYQKSLAIKLKQLGPDHPDVATSYNNIGGVYDNKAEYDKALEYHQKSLAIDLKQLGPDHPDVALSYNNIGLVQHHLKKPNAALAAARKARAIEDKRLAYMFSFTSERERLAYQKTQYPYNLLGTLGSAPDLAQTVLHNKGIVLASLLEDQLVAKASKDPAIKALAGQLRSAQHVLNKVQLEIPEPKAKEAHEAKRKAAMAKVEQLQQEMARNVKGLGKARRALAIEPKDVQKNLTKDEILLEFIRYWHWLGTGQTQERYGVVVLAKEGEAQWVPLGAAKEIDELCLNYGSYLKDDRITDEQYVPLLRALYDRLMEPIAKVVPKTAKTWIISPASQINFVNFATFLTPKDRFVCEDYTIKYVASGRDLVPPKEKKPKTNPQLVVFANPKYENKPPTLAVVTRDVGETTLRSAERNDLRASILGLSPLPGTQKEADYLEDKASDWKLEPRIFVEDEAVERQLYKVDSPKVLHLATHGMFLEKPPEKKKSRPGLMAVLLGKSSTQRKDFIGRLQNPMQRSALMFTGATWTSEQWAKGATPDTANDGILTAAEVGTLNLKGTKLVVMSACQTGLGDLRSGEGVMGLRRGFIQAGTQNLLMTLWPVSDSLTVAVMKDFYAKAMAKDGDAPVALAEVQRDYLVAIRKMSQFRKKEIGVKKAVDLAGPFILSFQKEAEGEEKTDSPKK